GPIARGSHLIPQIQNKRIVDSEKIVQGLFLILLGLFKKIAIADVIAKTIDPCFTQPWYFVPSDLWMATYLFSIQIYCDFSGYTDIAKGSAKLFGIELAENFKQPYLSTNIAD